MEEGLTIDRVGRLQGTLAGRDCGQRTRRPFREMQHDAYRRIEVGRQPAHELHQRPNSASGRADDDHVASIHVTRHRQKPAIEARLRTPGAALLEARQRRRPPGEQEVSALRYSWRHWRWR